MTLQWMRYMDQVTLNFNMSYNCGILRYQESLWYSMVPLLVT